MKQHRVSIKYSFALKFISIISFGILFLAGIARAEVLFTESFENNNFSARGWYDGNPSAGGIVSGGQSGNCFKWAWTQGAVMPSDFQRSRKLFTDTDSLYISFYIKFDQNWRGSQVDYHPHMIYLLSNLDGDYAGPSYSFLDTYIEFKSDIGSPYATRPMLLVQDGRRVSRSGCNGNLPCDISASSENRAVGGCNGCKAGSACGNFSDCYQCSSGWCNGRGWLPSNVSVSKGRWVRVEYFFKMNSISQNVGQPDGALKMWLDGTQVVNHSNMVYRTNQDATKKFRQFMFGPWIEVGSPIAQTMWLDELVVGTDEPYVSGDTSAPAAPGNLNVN